ncbi:hypothetical protein HMPREF2132_02430 [Prevotella histicola JCM 15637 = DNF00424]|uniref:Uncharacterized protein n=1 Tax=Prevotella histicola JCM 15637 = DNF00424 TaxID=1236504 RepID=A0AAW3FGT8_9BACT|nr:hypothetical protein HMPREF2132_02430 [Prevotella histicola JCM 15637 = DNF00424]
MGYKTRRRWGSFIVKQIHDWKTEDALSHGKRRPFTHQKMPFYHAKEHLLQRKRASFTTLFITSCIPKGYKPQNNT